MPPMTEAAYKRGDALAKRRKLMEAWAEFCGGSVAAKEAAVDTPASHDALQPGL